MRKLIAGKLSKGDKLQAVDHAQMQYPPFRRASRRAGWPARPLADPCCGLAVMRMRRAPGALGRQHAFPSLRLPHPTPRHPTPPHTPPHILTHSARRRNFYIEVPELARMSEEEVAAYRRSLDGVKVRGKAVPKPVKNWNQVRAWLGGVDLIRGAGWGRQAWQQRGRPHLMAAAARMCHLPASRVPASQPRASPRAHAPARPAVRPELPHPGGPAQGRL